MTNYERIRNQTVEEVAPERIHLKTGEGLGKWYYVGDFYKRVIVVNYECSAAYAEALRLEMEWLKSEVG